MCEGLSTRNSLWRRLLMISIVFQTIFVLKCFELDDELDTIEPIYNLTTIILNSGSGRNNKTTHSKLTVSDKHLNSKSHPNNDDDKDKDKNIAALSFEKAFEDDEEQQQDLSYADDDDPNNRYCRASLCAIFDGVKIQQVPHIACKNDGKFASECGSKPYLLYMGETRRNLILNMHNLARERIASGRLEGYRTATRMPLIRWDNELEYLATLHVKRCKFAHDQCHNMQRFPFSGQNIGYFWIQSDLKSFTKHMKRFIINWFKEYLDANQTFIDRFRSHPEG